MSATDDHEVAVFIDGVEQNTEPAERPVLRRTYTAALTPGDGRTVDVRVVPYGVPAEVSDDGRTSYREEWAEGCFNRQLNAANRVDVLMNFEHEKGSSGLIGKGISLRSLPDGLHGTFRIFDNDKGNIMLDLVNDGILGGVSLEAYSKKAVRTVDGTLRRIDARLVNVALCRTPAFTDAKVLAVREDIQPEVIFDEEFIPVDMDPELVARCQRLGLKLPQRYQAHPEMDTPADAGTSEESAPATPNNTDSQE